MAMFAVCHIAQQTVLVQEDNLEALGLTVF